jgi:hypothetical protein
MLDFAHVSYYALPALVRMRSAPLTMQPLRRRSSFACNYPLQDSMDLGAEQKQIQLIALEVANNDTLCAKKKLRRKTEIS